MERHGNGHGTGPLRRVFVAAAVLSLLTTASPATAQIARSDTTGLPPAGYGRFTREQISVRLETPSLSVMITPLQPAALRLLPRDAYDSMAALLRFYEESIIRIAGRTNAEPGLLLVSFFGKSDRVRFEPQDIALTTPRGFLRPLGIVPVTARWSDGEVNTGEVMRAIYVMDRGFDVLTPVRFSYGTTADDSWSSRLPGFENELARVRGRAAADRNR